jgi:hypothetical protein
MSRSALIVTVIVTTALIVLCAVGVVPRLRLSPAAQAADVFVEVTPTTVDAGFLVGIRASCGGGSDPATVESGAFGKVTVHAQDGFLTAAATVPITQRAGYYTVRLSCQNGRSATARLGVVDRNGVAPTSTPTSPSATPTQFPSRGPATGFGGTAGGHSAMLLVTGGLVALGASLCLGLVTVRRRRTGG